MTGRTFSDEELMAYADGELDAESTRALEACLAEDAALRERLAPFTGTRDALRAMAHATPPDPVPDALQSRVMAVLEATRARTDATVVPFARKPEPPRAARWQPAALAASLALAVGLAAGFGLGRGEEPGPQGALGIALLEAEGLAGALDTVPSGATQALPAGSLSIIASFETDDGTLCREFELDGASGATIVSVACHADSGWAAQFAVTTAPEDGVTFAPASSLETLEAYLSAIGAGPVLAPEAEAARLGALQD